MTKQELIQLLRNKQQECANILEEENEELYFFKIFFQRNDFLGIKSIVETDYSAFLLAYLLMCLANVEDRKDAYQYLKEEVISIKEIIDESNFDGLDRLLQLCQTFKDLDALEEARDYFDIRNQKLGKFSLKRIMIEKIISETLITSNRTLNEERNLGSFINLYLRGGQAFICAIKMIMDMKVLEGEYQSFQLQMNLYDLNSKERKQMQSMFKNSFDLTQFNKEIRDLRTYYEKIISEDRTRTRNNQKEQKSYETLEGIISKTEEGQEIKDIDKALLKVSDPKVQQAVLQYVLSSSPFVQLSILSRFLVTVINRPSERNSTRWRNNSPPFQVFLVGSK